MECRLRFSETVSLGSERFGVLAEVAEPGQILPAGGVVARLSDDTVRFRREIAAQEAGNDVEVRFTRKAAELASLKHRRSEEANRAQPGAVSELELRELLLAAEKATLQAEQAEHTLRLARLRLAEADAEVAALRIVAPTGVFVRAVHKRPGEIVQPGEVVAEVVKTDEVLVEAHLPIDVAGGLRLGQSVAVDVERSGAPLRLAAAIRFIDVKVAPVSQRVRVVARAQNPGGSLREGQAARFLVPGRPGAIARR